jgi:zinc protease
LAVMLGEGPSSRLYKKLVYESQLASGVGVYNSPNKDPGLFQILISLKPGVTHQRVERIVNNEIRRARTIPFSDAEIQKAKNNLMTSNVSQLKTIYGKGQALAFNEIVMGSYEHLFKDLERYNQVTKEQVMGAAKEYLEASRRNLVVLKPKAKK